jgi:hypothetical protein
VTVLALVASGCANSRSIYTPEARVDEPQIQRYGSARPRFGERLRDMTTRILPGQRESETLDEPLLEDENAVIRLGPEDIDSASAPGPRRRSSRVSIFDPRR